MDLNRKSARIIVNTPPSTACPSLAGWDFLVLAGACQIGTAWAGLRLNLFMYPFIAHPRSEGAHTRAGGPVI